MTCKLLFFYKLNKINKAQKYKYTKQIACLRTFWANINIKHRGICWKEKYQTASGCGKTVPP